VLPAATSNNRSYAFGGWFVDGTRVFTFADVQLAKGAGPNVQAIAYWTFRDFAIGEIMFSMTLNTMGGTIFAGNYDRAVFGDLNRELRIPSRTGHIFGGWFFDGVYEESHRVVTHADIIPLWETGVFIAETGTFLERPNHITLYAWWNVRPPQWWEVQ
jgi:hypothetical protein